MSGDERPNAVRLALRVLASGGVDSAWEQQKLEATKTLKNAASSACPSHALLASMVLSRTTAEELDLPNYKVVIEIKPNSREIVSNKIIPA